MNDQNFKIESELIDFDPSRKSRTAFKTIFAVWIGVFIFAFLYIFLNYKMQSNLSLNSSAALIIFSIILIALMILPILLLIIKNMLQTIHRYDHIDYSMIKKYLFFFTTSDGLKHYCYLYTHKDVDLFEKDQNGNLIKRPTIIGIHGYRGHHRIMDRYCLPTIIEGGKEKSYVLISPDVRGHGLTKGDPNDFIQFRDAKEFLKYFKELPFVDKNRICVAGMSLGASKAAILAYPDPEIKLIILLSGTFDMELTKKSMSLPFKIGMRLIGFPMGTGTKEELEKLSGINYFKKEGVMINGKLVPNSERVFITANKDDTLVTVKNSLDAIEKLDLPEENYRIYEKGKHIFIGNEWLLSAALYHFIEKRL
ncbi:MAG: alpha/beta hydrolase family protein [Promethearchaeota archaeon]